MDKVKQGKRNKRAGYYFEKKAEKLAKEYGLEAKRMWGSGIVPELKNDLVIEGGKYEVKSRKKGFGFDEILNDQEVRGLITYDTSSRGMEALVRIRFSDYLRLMVIEKSMKKLAINELENLKQKVLNG